MIIKYKLLYDVTPRVMYDERSLYAKLLIFTFICRPQNGGEKCEGSEKGMWQMCNTQVGIEF